MKKLIITTILLLSLLTAGCTSLGSSPSDTVENFVSEFDQGNYDTCYQMMSSGYRQETGLAGFISLSRDVNPEKYEFIEVTEEYVDGDTAVVNVLVNESSVAVKFSLKDFFKVEEEHEEVVKQIELIKQEDEWKFTKFPYALT